MMKINFQIKADKNEYNNTYQLIVKINYLRSLLGRSGLNCTSTW